jgi:hypothetical protein
MPEKEGPVEDDMKAQIHAVGQAINDFLNPDQENKEIGFCILMFKFGEPPTSDRMNYLSNTNREDMIAAMKEFVARAEGRHHDFDPAIKQ